MKGEIFQQKETPWKCGQHPRVRMMRLRIIGQAIAIILILIFVALRHSGG